MGIFDREDELARQVQPFLEPSWTVLDVGGGNGHLSARIAACTGTRITVCDVMPGQAPGMERLTMTSATMLPCADGSFDAVTMLFMLHHMSTSTEQDALLREARRVARRRLVLLEDTAVGRVERVLNRAWDFVLNAPSGVPTPFTFRSTGAWEEAVQRAGFQVRQVATFRTTWPILRSYTQTVLAADTVPSA